MKQQGPAVPPQHVARGACRAIRVTAASVLSARAGRVWVTVEGDPADYWLAAGEALPLGAGERIRVGGWDEAVGFELAPLVDAESGRPPWFEWLRRLAPRRAGRLRGWQRPWRVARGPGPARAIRPER